MTNNGVTPDIVAQELAYALETSKLLYEINLKKTFRRCIFNMALLVIRFFRMERFVKKILKKGVNEGFTDQQL
jgi:hypothetical protein